MQTRPANLLRFGPFELDLRAGRLTRSGSLIRLRPQAFRVLARLVQSAGQVITREELRQDIWGKDNVADFDQGLNFCIRQIRLALRDNASAPVYIETLTRHGYRFIAPVEEVTIANDSEDAAVAESTHAPGEADNAANGVRRWRLINLVGILIVLVVLCAAAYRLNGRNQRLEAEAAHRTAMDLLRRRDLISMKAATHELRKAVQLQPNFAAAWAGLAEAAALVPPNDARASMSLAEHAVRLDPACGHCRGVLGFVLFTRLGKPQDAREHLTAAVALDPNDAQLRYWLAQLRAVLGDSREALRIIEEGRRRSLEALNLLIMKAGALYLARDYEASVRASDEALAVGLPAGWHWRSKALFQLVRDAEAIESLMYDFGSVSVRSPESISVRAGMMREKFKESGRTGVLNQLLAETEGIPAHYYNRAIWLMLLGRHDAALSELRAAIALDSTPFDMIYIGTDPVFDSVRKNKAFNEIVGKSGFMQPYTAPGSGPLRSTAGS